MPIRLLILPSFALALVAIATVPCQAAAVDYFLKMDGIQGESTDAKHKGELKLDTFNWGATASPSSNTGGGGAGKVTSLSTMHFTLPVGTTTQDLYDHLSQGKTIKTATLFVVRSSGDATGKNASQIIEQVEFDTLRLTTFSDSGADGSVPIDDVTLTFLKAKVSKLSSQGVPPLPTGVGAVIPTN